MLGSSISLCHFLQHFCGMYKFESHFWSPAVQCWGSLIHSEPKLYTYSLLTPFGLVIPLLQSSVTCNYIHSQLFLTLLKHLHNYNPWRSWLQSLITLITRLRRLTSQLSLMSQIITHCRTRKVFTLQCDTLVEPSCSAASAKTELLY
jgi:hypothetical protein